MFPVRQNLVQADRAFHYMSDPKRKFQELCWHAGLLGAKFGWNLPNDSGEDESLQQQL